MTPREDLLDAMANVVYRRERFAWNSALEEVAQLIEKELPNTDSVKPAVVASTIRKMKVAE